MAFNHPMAEGKRFLFEWREALLSEYGPDDPNLQHVLLVISLFADCDSGKCWPSQRTLANRSRRGLDTVNRKIKEAKKLGWITVSKVGLGGQRWKRVEYGLSIPHDIQRKLETCSSKGVPMAGTPLCDGQENQGPTSHSAGKCSTVAGLHEGVPTAGTSKGVPMAGTPLCDGQENQGPTSHSAGKCRTVAGLHEGVPTAGTSKGVPMAGTPLCDGQENQGPTSHSAGKRKTVVGLREGVPTAGTKVFLQQEHNSLIELPTNNAFSDKSEKAPAGGRRSSSQTPNPHFSAKAGDYLPVILATCQKIDSLPQKKKAFNVYQWVQHQANHQKHPGAIQESLKGLIALWNEIESPWAYADAIMKTKNGNFNERDAIAEAAKFKSEWVVNEKVRDLIGEVGRRMPGRMTRM